MAEKILLTPGPINLSYKVKSEMLIDYGSRDSTFLNNINEIKTELKQLFNLEDGLKIILLQGSGTYGVESVLAGIDKKILVLINGSYGHRIKTILTKNIKDYTYIEFAEGEEIDYNKVKQVLDTDRDIEYIAFVHLETSTGVLNNLETIKLIKNEYNKRLIVDCIASFGSDIFNFNDIDYIITSSNKCLQGVPGFTIIIAKDFVNYNSVSYVLDLKDQHEYHEKTGQFRFTPPTHVLMAFRQALRELKCETLINRVNRYKNIKNEIYSMCERLSIQPFVDREKYSTGNICHTFLYPDNTNFNFEKLYTALSKYNYLIYPGKLTKINSFRIGSIGIIDTYEIKQFANYFDKIYNSIINETEFVSKEINPLDMYNYLDSKDINFYTGVPDSLLQDYNNCVLDKCKNQYITPNEGLAISMACGYYTSTGKIPCVYLQNSGIGNIINPLMSLAHQNVYSIPLLIMIGWRGEPNVHDEPQHVSQGECMMNLIKSMGFDAVLLDKLNYQLSIDRCIDLITKNRKPVFLVVSKGLFSKYKAVVELNKYQLIRRDVLEHICLASTDNDILCCTTGKSSRELDEVLGAHNINKARSFLMVGSMGHLSAYCLGMSLYTKKRVWCIDGDGAVLMHYGMMPYIGYTKATNLVHILLNHGMHESVGTQPTIAQTIDFSNIAKEVGYKNIYTVTTKPELTDILTKINQITGLTFIHVLMSNKPSDSGNLSRPKTTPKQRLDSLIQYLATF